MTTPQVVPAAETTNRRTRSTAKSQSRFIGVAALVALSLLDVGHGAKISNAQPSRVSTTSAHPKPQPGPAPRPLTRQPRITFVDQPTPTARGIIAWAVERYSEAGLQLPDLTISFPTFCGGKEALYHVGRRSIEFCFISSLSRRTVLHEFAHAWDDTSGAVDRQAFLKMRRLSIWWGGTAMASSEQGAEQLAQIIAWGLMDVDTRGVPQLPANSVSELTKAFIMLTGGLMPRQAPRGATRQS